MIQHGYNSAGGMPFRPSSDAYDRPRYYYPSIPHIQTPPVAYIQHGKRPSEAQRTDDTRVASSISTESGSSGSIAYQKRRAQTSSPSPRWPSPSRQQTLVDHDQYYPCPAGQRQTQPASRTNDWPKKSEMAETTSPVRAYIQERRQIEEEDDEDEDDHAIWVWFWLSALDPLHSFASCLFTLVVTFGLLLATPIRLVHKQSSFGDQVIRTVAPLFKHHLEMMYASSVDHAYEWDFRPGMLVLIHLTSPIISVGVAVASWVNGAFWVFTSIMGNPDGTERRDDGADAVLAVRNWWEGCLLKATKPPVKQSKRSTV